MKILFIDEIKDVGIINKDSKNKGYGLVCTLIDAQYYRELNENFKKHLKDFPNFDSKKEIKGSSLFSGNEVGKNISIMKKILSLSCSKSKKTSKFQTFVCIDFFGKEKKEIDCYNSCLKKIISKIPKNNSGKKKSLISVIADENNCFGNSHNLFDDEEISTQLQKRNYYLFEKCIFIKSDNNTMGILFSDYIGYVFKSLINFKVFNKNNKNRVLNLLKKSDKSESETKELQNHFISYKKSDTCSNLISEIKKVTVI
ncbi:MAG: hypothetical protein PHS54_07415 [Clostridia bacterium]|nr:hypothetical protein [Clostridia bacterium]